MSHFYGTLKGQAGEATRCGSRASGIVTYAAGWRGAIRVEVFLDEQGEDAYRVALVPWGNSSGISRQLASGKLTLDERTEQ